MLVKTLSIRPFTCTSTARLAFDHFEKTPRVAPLGSSLMLVSTYSDRSAMLFTPNYRSWTLP